RGVGHLLQDVRVRRAIAIAEKFCDGLISKEAMVQVSRAAQEGANATEADRRILHLVRDLTRADVRSSAGYIITQIDYEVVWRGGNWGSTETLKRHQTEFTRQADLLRDIIGNPFRPVTMDPAWAAWNGGTAVRLAEAMYRDHRFDAMPVLGDALEEAACTDTTILAHCRQLDGHVRGCWVADQLLGKH